MKMEEDMATYEAFIMEDPNEIPEGEETELQVRDSETFEQKVVKCIVSKDPSKLEGADELLVRWQRGQAFDKKWAIKILEDKGSVMDQPIGSHFIKE
jgi:hypothetical protein